MRTAEGTHDPPRAVRLPARDQAAALATPELVGLDVSAFAAFQDRGAEALTLAVEVRRPPTDAADRVRRADGELTRVFGVTVTGIVVGSGTIPRTTSGKVRRLALARGWGGAT